MIMQTYIAAIISSSIIPVPPGIASDCLAGNGLIISNTRHNKNVKPINIRFFGRKRREIHIPTASSMVHSAGSFPYFFSNRVPT